MVKPLWNTNHWRMQIPQTCCVPARFVSLFINYAFPVSSVRVCILMLTVSSNHFCSSSVLCTGILWFCIVLDKDNLIFVCLIVWRTPAQWWSGLRVQKTTLTVLLTISWAMKRSGTWSMLFHSGEKPMHMEMVNSCTSTSQMWLKCFKNQNCCHYALYSVPNRTFQHVIVNISQWIVNVWCFFPKPEDGNL